MRASGTSSLTTIAVLQKKFMEDQKLPDRAASGTEGGDEACLDTTESTTLQMNSQVVAEAEPPRKYLAGHPYIKFDGDMDQDSDEEPDEKDGSTPPLEEKDPAAQRSDLLARLKVVEAMLQQVAREEQLRAQREASVLKAGNNNVLSSSHPLGEHGVDHKRQRRPNPKYFDSEIEAEFQMPGSSPTSGRDSFREEGSVPFNNTDSQALQNAGNSAAAVTPIIARSDYLTRMRSPMIQRARTALTQKHRVFSLSESSTVIVKTDSNLDNLSIRELHEAYRKVFARNTSVKDKHWLKRQIFMGLSIHNGTSNGKENSRERSSLDVSSMKARVDKYSTAEVPLSASSTVIVNGKRRSKVSDASCSPDDGKRAHRKTLSLAGLLPLNSPNPSPAGECSGGANQGGTHNHVQKLAGLIGGKRVRKPNRRYIEDEEGETLGFAANGSRSILSTLSNAGNGLRSNQLKLSGKNYIEVVEAKSKRCVPINQGMRASTRSYVSNVLCSKQCRTGMKKKIDARAAKLVKMAHSSRAAKLDVQNTVRKVKFRLPAAPGQEKGEVLSGGDGEQVSCLLPVLIDEGMGDHDLINSRYQSRLEENDDQAVLTVPTANGGIRRKHHRPWTLREVVTLVEGVARCGGGKWADIKKLAFSTVSYRTAVDLKDKWRNLLRASRAQLYPPKQGETRKKQFSAAIPPHLLARVRELAALNNQTMPNVIAGSSTSRSGRVVHKR